MRVKQNKTADYKSAVISLMKQEYENQGNQLLTKLDYESKRQLSRTLKFATPRSERGKGGFGGATALTVKSVIKRTNFGVTIFLQVQVIDKTTNKPHTIWHKLSSGTNNEISKKRFIYKLRKNRRTRIGSLDVDPFTGFTGEYRTMKKGGRMPDIEGRRWYELTLEEVENSVDEGLFTFVKKEGNEHE